MRADQFMSSTDATAQSGVDERLVALSVREAYELLHSSGDGLTTEEARDRLRTFGPNELPERPPESLALRAGRQLAEPMSFLLVAAAAVAGFGLRKGVDAIAILAIVLANVVIALLQEGKAANALRALRTIETPVATVRRDGHALRVASREIVPGDVLLLAAGDRVPADARLLEAASLELDESMLTGESLPVPKGPDLAGSGPKPDRGLAEQRSIVFAGTLVVRGTAEAVTLATGARTQLGAIAARLQEREPQTPLQRELRRMTGRLGVIAVVVALAVFVLMLVRLGANAGGFEIAFLSAAALAVAAVPEGLPTVVTVALALGVRRMAGRGSIVRRLPAVETLGSTTVILTDKTGTLTQNRMHLDGVVRAGDPGSSEQLDPTGPMAEVLVLCNDATLEPPTGDPTEIAMLEAVGAARVAELRAQRPRAGVAPFDSERKRMTTAHAEGAGVVLLMKGAPEVVLARCATANAANGTELLSADARARMMQAADALASRGARVLALATRTSAASPAEIEDEEHDFDFLGLIALRDPVRPEAAAAVAEAAAAGIRIVMVTGDHPGTALAVAQDVGLVIDADAGVLTGRDIRRDGFPLDPLDVPVYARVDPDEKLALTEALQAHGHVVAVTGDGVNDAPALRRADIGVAMGRAGSDVAREAADMIVTDDNLATVVDAVREGRGIYDNIRKVVEYLVAGNLSEIMVVVGGLLFFPALGVPLLPLQLLWINLLTDGFPALALGVDPVDTGLMERAPRSRADQLLLGKRLGRLLGRAVLIATASLASLAIAHYAWNEPWAHARASMFSVLMTAHLLYAFAVRGRRGARTSRNPWLVAAVLGGLALQVIIVSTPALHQVFGTASLSLREWVLVAVAGALPPSIMLVSGHARRSTGLVSGGTIGPFEQGR